MGHKLFRCFVITAVLVLVLGTANGSNAASIRNDKPAEQAANFAPGELLVKFKGVLTQEAIGSVAEADVMASMPAAAMVALDEIQATVMQVYPITGILKVQVGGINTAGGGGNVSGPAGSNELGRAIEMLYRSGAVEYAEPNYEVKVNATPTDPRFSEQWGHNNTGLSGGTVDADIDSPEGWNSGTSGTGTVVVVIDTGVDYNHEDLALNMWKNPKEIPGNGKDDDGNGYIDDVYGIDTYNHDTNPMDDYGHGTHCSGIIGAKANNGKGVAGVAWTAKIMALKFLSSSGSGYTDGAIACMEYALAIKAANNYPHMIWSNSWGGGSFSQALYDTIKLAGDKSVLFVASAGNNALNADASPSYPGGYDLPNIINVGASNRLDNMSSFSNYGSFAVDIFAPGEQILSTLPGNTYASWDGTSMACPFVSGSSALLWTKYPSYQWKRIKGLILNSAEDGKAAPVFDGKVVTEGRLNLYKALQTGINDDPAIFSVTPNIAGPGDTITVVGFNFLTAGTLRFLGASFDTASIVSWTNEKIVAKVPTALPKGFDRIKVSTTGGISRGAFFGNSVTQTLAGQTVIGHGYAANAQIGNNVWIFGGGTHWGQTGLVEKYALNTNIGVINGAWMMPTPVTNAGAAAIGSNIYVVGGLDWDTDTVYNKLQIFNTLTGTWSSGAAMPANLCQPAVVASGGKLYVIGGMDAADKALNTVYVYSPTTNKWITKAPMLTAVANAAAVPFGTTGILVMGGFSTPYYGYELKTVQQYTISTNAWTAKADMKKSRGGAAGVYYNAKAFCLNGSGEGTRGLKDSEYYAAGVWKNEITGQQALYMPAGGLLTDKIFSLSGYDYYGVGYSRNVWRLTSP